MLENSPLEAGDAVARRSKKYEPKRRLKTLAHLDQRTLAARRIAELVSTWSSALGNRLTPGQRIAVERAAGLTALAEDAKARRLSGDLSISLWDTVRLDNSAARAVAALGLPNGHEREHSDMALKPIKW